MSYGIYFDSDTGDERLRQALHSVYGVDPALVYVGPADQLNAHPGPDPIVLITRTAEGGQFAVELAAGETLASVTRASEFEVARALCRAADTRALISDDSPAPDYWILVTRDGSYGRVFTDPDADGLVILHAFEPIAGEPDLPVVPPPDWARTW